MSQAVILAKVEDLGAGISVEQARAQKAASLSQLWHRWGSEPRSGRSRTRNGRPRCPVRGFDHSSAHDRGLVGVALGTARLGLDVMRWRAVPNSVARWLAKLAGREQERDPAEPEWCVKEWTRLEAVVKYLGGSVAGEWRRTSVGDEPSAVRRFEAAGGRVDTWELPVGAVSIAHWRPSTLSLDCPGPEVSRVRFHVSSMFGE